MEELEDQKVSLLATKFHKYFQIRKKRGLRTLAKTVNDQIDNCELANVSLLLAKFQTQRLYNHKDQRLTQFL